MIVERIERKGGIVMAKQGVQPLALLVEPFTVQNCIHLRGRKHLYRPESQK